jgi:hypothetical protein
MILSFFIGKIGQFKGMIMNLCVLCHNNGDDIKKLIVSLVEDVHKLKEHKNRQIDENRKISDRLDEIEDRLNGLSHITDVLLVDDVKKTLNDHDKYINDLIDSRQIAGKRHSEYLEYMDVKQKDQKEINSAIIKRLDELEKYSCTYSHHKAMMDRIDTLSKHNDHHHKEFAKHNSRIEELEHLDGSTVRLQEIDKKLEEVCNHIDHFYVLERLTTKNFINLRQEFAEKLQNSSSNCENNKKCSCKISNLCDCANEYTCPNCQGLGKIQYYSEKAKDNVKAKEKLNHYKWR